MFGVLLDDGIENLVGLGTDPRKESVPFPSQIVSALAAGSEGHIVGQMAEKVELVGFGPSHGPGQYIEGGPPLFEPLDDLNPAPGIEPASPKLGRVWIERAHLLAGVVGEMLAGQPSSISIELVDQVPNDFDIPVIHIELARIGSVVFA